MRVFLSLLLFAAIWAAARVTAPAGDYIGIVETA
jgi:hypothetical protein